MPTVTATQARSQLYRLIDDIATSHQPVVITGKRRNAVLMSEEDWQAVQETLYLMCNSFLDAVLLKTALLIFKLPCCFRRLTRTGASSREPMSAHEQGSMPRNQTCICWNASNQPRIIHAIFPFSTAVAQVNLFVFRCLAVRFAS